MPEKSAGTNDAMHSGGNSIPDAEAFIQAFLVEPSTDESVENIEQISLVELRQELSLLANKLATNQAKANTGKESIATLEKILISRIAESGKSLSQGMKNSSVLIDSLFHSLVDESMLEENIKHQLNRLRIPYLLLVTENPKILLEKQQVTRQLLNDLISAGQLWSPDDVKSQQIFAQISSTIEQILKLCSDNVSLQKNIPTIVEQFSHFTGDVVKRTEIFEKRIREAEEGKAKAMEAKATSSQIIEKIICKDNIPEFILQMLTNAWQHILFLQQLKGDNKQEPEEVFIAKALLVSLQPINTIEEIEKFLELQPILLEKLKTNLEKTSYSFVETNAFLEELDTYHNELLINAKHSLEKGPTEEILRLAPLAQMPNFDGQPESILNDETPDLETLNINQWVELVFKRLPQTHAMPTLQYDSQSRKEKDKHASEKIIRMLKPGRWLLLELGDAKIRGKLSAYIEANDKYIIVNGTGGKLAEFDTLELIQAYQQKKVTILENEPLFERAFKNVVNELFEQHLSQINRNKLQPHPQKEAAKNKQETINQPTENEINKRNTTQSTTPEEVQIGNDIEASQSDLDNLSRLAVGSWMEIKVGYKMTKCRLAAKISSTGKFIFTDRTGIKVKECFNKDLATLFRNGELKLDEENTFYDKAFTSVINNLRNLKTEKT